MKKNYLGCVLSIMFLFSMCKSDQPDDKTLLLYARAAGIYSQGHFLESAEILSRIKNFPPALVLKGKAEFFSDKHEEAEMSFKRALKLNPNNYEASIYLARVLRENGRYKEAENIAETLLKDNPYDIRSLRLAADLSKENGSWGAAAAEAYLNRAVEASVELALVFLDRSRLRWQNNNGAGALDDLKRAGAILPADSPLKKSISNFESLLVSIIFDNNGAENQ